MRPWASNDSSKHSKLSVVAGMLATPKRRAGVSPANPTERCSHGAVRRFACMCAGRGHDAPQGRGYSWAADTAATTAAMLGVVAAMVTGQG